MTLPLHERIRSEIEGAILSGALAPGARLPIESELVKTYGCSRMTVNKALSALAGAGLIDRRKRAGSSVSRPRVHSMALDVPDLPVEVRGRGQDYRYRLLSRVVRRGRGAKDGPLDIGTGRVLAVDGLHLADGMPLAVEHRLVSLATVPDIADAGFEDEPPGTWLLRHVPWTQAETRIAAVAADDATAALLGVEAGTPSLLIERRTWRGDDRITAVRQYFLGSAYDLVARFGHGAGSGR